MESMVKTRTYDALPIDRREILRYMGGREGSAELDALLSSALEEALAVLTPVVVYASFPVRWEGERLDLGFSQIDSHDLARALDGCERVLVFAATVGIGIDRLLIRYGRLSPARALCMQAIGAERIEALCDAFCADMAEECASFGEILGRRFSPGYGDLPLSLQKEIFAALDCSRRIGLTLGEQLLMSPTKSVTALVGVCRTIP